MKAAPLALIIGRVFTGLIGVLVPSTVFKTACDLRARSAGFDSQAVPPTIHTTARVLAIGSAGTYLPLLHKKIKHSETYFPQK
ncbi:hypothetical protein CHI10_01150 [Bacillus sp. 7894-2]|nr:hypothetical protein CHI10_01150 [Bacillus sp. 7894-2]